MSPAGAPLLLEGQSPLLDGHCAPQPASPDGQLPHPSVAESQQEPQASVETMQPFDPPLSEQHELDEDSRYIKADTTHPAPKSPTPTSFKIDMSVSLFLANNQNGSLLCETIQV
jgi:hypothetical protein